MRLKLFFLILILIPSVLGIGISPALRTIDYVPGSEYTFTDTVSNNRDVPIDVILSASGELAPYVTMHMNHTTLKANGVTKFSYDFVIPDGLEPGSRVAHIGVQDDTQRGGGMFGIKVKVKGIILVKIPYPGRYARLKLETENVNEGDDINYAVSIENLGVERINHSTLTVQILDSQQAVLKEVVKTVTIDGKSAKNIAGSFPGEYTKGKYTITATYEYDRVLNKSNDIFIGAYEMLIRSHSEHLYHNQITPFETTIKSLWNGDIEDAYVTVEIGGEEFRSISTPFLPLQSRKLMTYIDDLSFDIDQNYTAIVTVHYGELNTSKTISLDVIEYTGKVKLEKPKKSEVFDNIVKVLIKPTTYLYIVIAILVLFNVSLLLKKKKKK